MHSSIPANGVLQGTAGSLRASRLLLRAAGRVLRTPASPLAERPPLAPRLTDIEVKPASPNRILPNPSDDGWRGAIYTPNKEITVEAPAADDER